MMTLYLLKYNNYYNRQVKYAKTVEEVKDYVAATITNVDFKYKDGISTEQIVNIAADQEPNYVIVKDGDRLTRWFVTDAVKIRQSQYRLEMRRDVIADAYTDVVAAPMFIERAWVSEDNPLIFNNEGFTFNQIKTEETLLKDSTGKAWIVGYASSTNDIKIEKGPRSSADIVYSGKHDDWLKDKPELHSLHNWRVGMRTVRLKSGQHEFRRIEFYKLLNMIGTDYNMYNTQMGPMTSFQPQFFLRDGQPGGSNEQLWNNINNWLANGNLGDKAYKLAELNAQVAKEYDLSADGGNYDNLNNKTILCNDGLYRIKVTDNFTEYGWAFPKKADVGNYLANNMNTIIKADSRYKDAFTKWGDVPFDMKYTTKNSSVKLEYISDGQENVIKINCPTSRQHLDDAPYDMFFMEATMKNMEIATLLGTEGGKVVLDIQLLPYCPNTNTISNPTLNKNKFIITKGTANYSEIYWSNTSSGSVKIDHIIEVAGNKISNETTLYRLCSPNYNGLFEFSPAKNGGVKGFEADFTYKPYSPYIHVHPIFSGLYGKDYEDARGLLCGGDFSLPRVDDAFVNYELNNKNYQLIFDRQIQSMEFNNNMSRMSDITSAIGGTISGGLGGAMGGFLVGGIPGAVIGGAAGTAGAAITGGLDAAINEQIRREQINYTKDQFNYNLGNIKALPQSVSKTGAFTINNKLFPFIEKYECTEKELEAFIKKLVYNGMSVGAIGSINDYLQPFETFICGKLIRLESNEYDTHYVNVLASELSKGAYWTKLTSGK